MQTIGMKSPSGSPNYEICEAVHVVRGIPLWYVRKDGERVTLNFDTREACVAWCKQQAATPAGKGEPSQLPCQRCGAYRPGCSDPLCPTPLSALDDSPEGGPPMAHRPPIDILPIQIREDLTVQIAGIPHDLTREEAEKIARVVLAMVTPEVAER